MKSRLLILLLLLFTSIVRAQDNPLPNLEPITADNAAQLVELTRYGNGILGNATAWSPDGKSLLVAGTIGIWLYDAENWDVPPQLLDFDEWVNDVAFSADGKMLAYATSNNVINLIEWPSRKKIVSFEDSDIFAFSPDGTTVALQKTFLHTEPYYRSFSIELWHIADLRSFATIPLSDPARELSFSPDGKLLAAATASLADSTCGHQYTSVAIWNMDDPIEPMSYYGGMGDAERAVFSPDGSLMVAIEQVYQHGWSGTMRLWDVKKQEDRFVIFNDRVRETNRSGQTSEYSFYVRDVVFNHDSSLVAAIVSSGEKKHIRLWDTRSGEQHLDVKLEVTIQALTFSPNDNTLIGITDNRLVIWQVGESLEQIAINSLDGSMQHVRFNDAGTAFTYQDNENRLHLWAIEQAEAVERVVSEPQINVPNLIYSQNGNKVVFTDDVSLNIWDVATGKESQIDAINNDIPFAISYDGFSLAYWSSDQKIRLIDIDTERNLSVLNADFPEGTNLKFSPDGTQLLITSQGEEPDSGVSIQIWDTVTGNLVHDFGSYEEGIRAAFSPDGTRIVISNLLNPDTFEARYEIRILDAATGEQYFSYAEDGNRIGRFTPDWSVFVADDFSWSGGYLLPVDVKTGTDVFEEIIHSTYAGGLSGFSPDSTFLLMSESSYTNCGGDYRAVQLWNLRTREKVAQIGLASGFGGWGGGGETFSPNSSLLIVADYYDISLWNTATGKRLGSLGGQESYNGGHTAFSANGTLLLSSGADGTVRLWGVPIKVINVRICEGCKFFAYVCTILTLRASYCHQEQM